MGDDTAVVPGQQRHPSVTRAGRIALLMIPAFVVVMAIASVTPVRKTLAGEVLSGLLALIALTQLIAGVMAFFEGLGVLIVDSRASLPRMGIGLLCGVLVLPEYFAVGFLMIATSGVI